MAVPAAEFSEKNSIHSGIPIEIPVAGSLKSNGDHKRTDIEQSLGALKMTISVVESSAGGGGSTYDRPPQRGFSQSWAPKKGTNTEPHVHGEISLIEHSGVAAIDARSSKGVTSDFIAAAHSGTVDAINSSKANPTVRQARLGSAPTSSDQYVSASTSSIPSIGAHPKSFLGLGRTLPSLGKQVEHVRKGDFQGSGLVENGYVHGNPDFPGTINLEMANDPPVKS